MNYTKYLKEKLYQFSVISQRIKAGILPNSFNDSSITIRLKPDNDITRKGNYRATSLMHINVKILYKMLAN